MTRRAVCTEKYRRLMALADRYNGKNRAAPNAIGFKFDESARFALYAKVHGAA